MLYIDYINRYLSRREIESPAAREILKVKYHNRDMPPRDRCGFVKYLSPLAEMMRAREAHKREGCC